MLAKNFLGVSFVRIFSSESLKKYNILSIMHLLNMSKVELVNNIRSIIEVQSNEECLLIEKIAKEKGVISGGTSRIGPKPLVKPSNPNVIDAGSASIE